ncbi:MAG: carbohydrate ABC transporter permease [Clostridiales bacterium]|nr:carbohydrate ABC transporter permease [Clostridiales bacterium]
MKIKTLKVRHPGFLTVKIVLFVILIVYGLSLLAPLAWCFLTALKDQVEFTTYNVNGLPTKWLFSNFTGAFSALSVNGTNMFSMTVNSLWYALGGAALGISVSSMVAYVVAKYDFPGKSFVYMLAIVTMMIPIVGAMPSQYRLYRDLGILNTPLLLLSFAGGFGFNFLALYAYFKNLSWNFAEAAFIDGAGHAKTFLKVMMPQAVPAILALLIVAAIGLWNDYSGPLLFLKSYPTLSSGLYMFQIMTTRIQNIPVLLAGVLLSALPVVALFVFFSGKIMDISFGGGLKG